MGSRHFSLNMSEVADTTDLLLAFEKNNKVRVTMEIGVKVHQTKPDLWVVARAYSAEEDVADQIILASVSVICSATNLKHLRDVLTHVLYALDFKLAIQEFESVEHKKA